MWKKALTRTEQKKICGRKHIPGTGIEQNGERYVEESAYQKRERYMEESTFQNRKKTCGKSMYQKWIEKDMWKKELTITEQKQMCGRKHLLE